jgi:hypothetical protein
MAFGLTRKQRGPNRPFTGWQVPHYAKSVA